MKVGATDMQDTKQLLIFIRGIDDTFYSQRIITVHGAFEGHYSWTRFRQV